MPEPRVRRARGAAGFTPNRVGGEARPDAEELDHWDDISHKMRLCFHGDRILSQFEGYDNLEELDWDAYRERYGDIGRLDRYSEAEGDTPNRYKLSKQADALMLFYVLTSEELAEIWDRLGYEHDAEFIPTQHHLLRDTNLPRFNPEPHGARLVAQPTGSLQVLEPVQGGTRG
ncbi:MAG: hypothetical protein M5U19_15305 [Microthrixaceae bacterium]|nr:hypothetical protein [Microthrixaceae bacterium]